MIIDKVSSAYKWELEQSSHQDHEINETPPSPNQPLPPRNRQPLRSEWLQSGFSYLRCPYGILNILVNTSKNFEFIYQNTTG